MVLHYFDCRRFVACMSPRPTTSGRVDICIHFLLNLVYTSIYIYIYLFILPGCSVIITSSEVPSSLIKSVVLFLCKRGNEKKF